MLSHKFFDFFEGYEDCYVIIDGNAAAIWLAQDHQDFRATQDYDMVVIFENSQLGFSQKFDDFIEKYGYLCAEIGGDVNKKKVYYRFALDPALAVTGVPQQIELFSKIPLRYELRLPTETMPLHFATGPSLSAIVLNDDYYSLLKQCQQKIGHVSILSVPGLIYFKAKAHLDIRQRLANGDKLRHRANKNKHYKDVCRLCDLIIENQTFDSKVVPRTCQNDLKSFIQLVEAEPEQIFKKRFKSDPDFDLNRDEVVRVLRSLLPTS